jgi:2-polyprenyl-3-methyl-5-hydroxy-6-metoxy-1,4-benzoquinol methylase
MVHPPVEQQENEQAAPGAPESRVDHVRSYFGQPRNYLDIRRYVIDARKETVQEWTAGRSFNRILDIGCGDGSLTVPLLAPGTRLSLLDISVPMLNKALSRVPPAFCSQVDTINMDFMQVPIEPATFDLVVCVGVLAHVESPSAVIEKATSVLRPGGLLILECTDATHFSNRFTVMMARTRQFLLRKDARFNSNLLSAKKVRAMAEAQGLTQLSTFRHNLALPLMRRFLSQDTLHSLLRVFFGNSKNNRNAWLGKECLFLFGKKS